MFNGNGFVLAIGLVIAIALVGVGVLLGRRLKTRDDLDSDSGMSQADRSRMLRLLQELGDWTHEYSGSVSKYQTELGAINDAVKSDASGLVASDSGHRVLLLLNQIMQSNSDLQTRLEAAEKQLERQTKQIECYLTEARTDGLTGLLNRRAV